MITEKDVEEKFGILQDKIGEVGKLLPAFIEAQKNASPEDKKLAEEMSKTFEALKKKGKQGKKESVAHFEKLRKELRKK